MNHKSLYFLKFIEDIDYDLIIFGKIYLSLFFFFDKNTNMKIESRVKKFIFLSYQNKINIQSDHHKICKNYFHDRT